MPVRPRRAIVLIDGEHHPAAVADALATLQDEVVALVFCGGGEKVAAEVLADPRQYYGYPLVRGDDPCSALRAALAGTEADVVIDLADEPLVGTGEKLRLAAVAMASSLSYEAPGMTLAPLVRGRADFGGPQIAVIGTGKRTGKTAVCGHLARLIAAAGGHPAIVSMGRGGPARPQVASPGTGLTELTELVRQGVHAASDYLEDAVLAGVPTVGARRVGGGPGGQTMFTNFEEAVEIAAALDGIDCLLYEGSGASLPPVAADRTVCIVGDRRQAEELSGPLRLLVSDLVLVPAGDEGALAAAERWTDGRVLAFELATEPHGELPADARIAMFTTGADQLSGGDPEVVSTNLARRAELAEDLRRAADAGCTHYLTEIKAAAIEVVAAAAQRDGAELVFLRNRPFSRDADLDEILLNLHVDAVAAA